MLFLFILIKFWIVIYQNYKIMIKYINGYYVIDKKFFVFRNIYVYHKIKNEIRE